MNGARQARTSSAPGLAIGTLQATMEIVARFALGGIDDGTTARTTPGRLQVLHSQARDIHRCQEALATCSAVMLAFVRASNRFQERLMAPVRAERFRREAAAAAVAAEEAEAARDYAVLRSQADTTTARAAAAYMSDYLAAALAVSIAQRTCIRASRRAVATDGRIAAGFKHGVRAVVAARGARADIVARAVRMHAVHADVARITAGHASACLQQCDSAARRAAIDKLLQQGALAMQVKIRTDRRANAKRGVLARKRCKAVSKARMHDYQDTRGVYTRACAAGIASAAAQSREATVATASTAAVQNIAAREVFARACCTARQAQAEAAGEPDDPAGTVGTDSRDACEAHVTSGASLPSAAQALSPASSTGHSTGRGADGSAGTGGRSVEPHTQPSAGGSDVGVGVSSARLPRVPSGRPRRTDSEAGEEGNWEPVPPRARARARSATQSHSRVLGARGVSARRLAPSATATARDVLTGVTFGADGAVQEGADMGGALSVRRPWTSGAAVETLRRVVADVHASQWDGMDTAAADRRSWGETGDITASVSVRHTERQVRDRNAPRMSAAVATDGEAAAAGGALPKRREEHVPGGRSVAFPSAVGELARAARDMHAPGAADLWQRAANQQAQTLRRVSFGGALPAAVSDEDAADDELGMSLLFRPVSGGGLTAAGTSGRDSDGGVQGGQADVGADGDLG